MFSFSACTRPAPEVVDPVAGSNPSAISSPVSLPGETKSCCSAPPSRFSAITAAADKADNSTPSNDSPDGKSGDGTDNSATPEADADSAQIDPPGMIWIAGGEFNRGTDDPDSEASERPAHLVSVSPFWMDATEVTNAQFKQFVDATNYVTTAEKPGPGRPRPASLVFVPTNNPVSPENPAEWWELVEGANWQHPYGPGSTITVKENHPVVHVSWDDTVAFCKWAGKRLPTEAEWELAARGGLEGRRYPWGNAPISDDRPQCNFWQGRFPNTNTRQDGYEATAPVRSFKPNGFRLHDMAGNVWEWCSDHYRDDTYAQQIAAASGKPIVDPTGPSDSYDAAEPTKILRVYRGGSFLSNDVHCTGYRPSARRGLEPNSTSCQIGFRCVKSANQHAASEAVAPDALGRASVDGATAVESSAN